MREEFAELGAIFPIKPPHRDPAFTGSPIKHHVEHTLRDAVAAAIGDEGRYAVEASAGQGGWTFTPWIVILDRAVTTSVEDGYYVVYLQSADRRRLYLTLNQGCTVLKKEAGMPAARETLRRRAEVMANRSKKFLRALQPIDMDLAAGRGIWRAELYELGVAVGVEYATANLPGESVLRAHLAEALEAYNAVKLAGGWELEDDMVADVRSDDAGETLEQAKRYKQHRAIERQAGHSKKVKKAQGTRCKGCEFEMFEVYGERARGVIDAHHLVPLADLADGEVVRFDPVKDFAVLCPNCHRAIHRMSDPSDLEALRAEIGRGSLKLR